MRSISSHIRSNLVAYLALFFALGGTAVASHEQIFSSDIVDGEVKAPDIGLNAVRAGEILNGEVRALDLATDAVRSTHILEGQVRSADVLNGGLTGTDVADDSLTGGDVDESSLGQVPNADKLDGIDASRFMQANGQALGGNATIFEGEGIGLIPVGLTSDPDFNVAYYCPQDSSSNGSVEFYNWENATAKLFVDNGSANPSFIGDLGPSSNRLEPAAASGEHIVFQAGYQQSRIVTVDVFSVHDPASDSCSAQAQALVTRP